MKKFFKILCGIYNKYFARFESGYGFNNYHYCSPGVGLIKIEGYWSSFSNTELFIKNSEMELIKLNVQK